MAYLYLDAGDSYGWVDVVRGGLEVLRVTGNHSNLLLEPNAAVLARSLGRALEQTRERTGQEARAASA